MTIAPAIHIECGTNGGARQGITSPWGSPAGNDISEWQMMAAEAIAGVNRILWRNNSANFLHSWVFDSSWGWQSSSGSFEPLSSGGRALLSDFGLS
jgi:hypothetical protein